ncbi:glycosyltransferase family 2 protein [Algiphilus sp. NNCM1]|uniref:glycosyltransferase family 2 protein n=1 Tax=Algiphilus sp. TaxID=1872431 RepID=UPI001CA7A673|nr:glycosyltransferase family 2 protein [Algiphilus sp.]MBY8966242.1 glycosyltransferase family 2 protein [Algiphilus acroporae]MCI5103687.1 glycosyltransferase family 2 protein [Algiphilus sp.]
MRNSARLSVVVPVFNEQDSIAALVERIHQALSSAALRWELILVNDGSFDATHARAVEACAQYGSHVRVVDLYRNFGQTAALQAGIDHARGDLIATMDGDLQNDPCDIPAMIERLVEQDLDLVAGWRKDRKDGLWLRKLPSRLANALIGRVTGVRLHDYGCTLKVFRASIVRDVRLYGEMHRFIPAWVAMRTGPSRIQEMPVRHHARQHGASKYGLSRTFRVIIDLAVVFFFLRYQARPGHFFGLLGFGLGALGVLALMHLFVLKLGGVDIGGRPLFLTAVMLVVLSVQMFSTAVLAEMMSRTYFESREDTHYRIRQVDAPAEDGWYGA